jgi:hypothetical protein
MAKKSTKKAQPVATPVDTYKQALAKVKPVLVWCNQNQVDYNLQMSFITGTIILWFNEFCYRKAQEQFPLVFEKTAQAHGNTTYFKFKGKKDE